MNAVDPVRAEERPPRPGLRMTAQRSPDGVTLRVSGEIDVDTAPALEAEICARLRCRPATVTVDLSEVTFLDCSGLNVLLRSHRRASHERTTLRIGPTGAAVTRFLALAGTVRPLPGGLARTQQRDVPAPVSGRTVPLAA